MNTLASGAGLGIMKLGSHKNVTLLPMMAHDVVVAAVVEVAAMEVAAMAVVEVAAMAVVEVAAMVEEVEGKVVEVAATIMVVAQAAALVVAQVAIMVVPHQLQALTTDLQFLKKQWKLGEVWANEIDEELVLGWMARSRGAELPNLAEAKSRKVDPTAAQTAKAKAAPADGRSD